MAEKCMHVVLELSQRTVIIKHLHKENVQQAKHLFTQ
jgi:hypothetical protein